MMQCILGGLFFIFNFYNFIYKNLGRLLKMCMAVHYSLTMFITVLITGKKNIKQHNMLKNKLK